MQPEQLFITLGGLSGATGVVAGAFGAHALKARLEPSALSAFETAVQYQLIHTLALLVTAWLCARSEGLVTPVVAQGAAQTAGWLFVAGIVLFSGSLYVLALGGPRIFGPVTPLGGVCFIAAWLALAWSAISQS